MTSNKPTKEEDIREMSQYDGFSVLADMPQSDPMIAADLLSRPRVRYFLYYPLFLACAALLLWIFPTDRMTAVSCLIATLVGCAMIWEILFTDKIIRFSNVCAFGLIMGYGFGTLNSWITLPRGGLPLAFSVGQTVPELADGVAAALMGGAVLLLLGELIEKPVWTTAEKLQVTVGMKWLVLGNTVIITLAFAAGKFRQGGAVTAGVHSAGVLAEFLEFLLAPTAIMAIVAFLVEKKRSDKYLFCCLAILYLISMVTQGRVPFVSTLLIALITARYFGYTWKQLSFGRLLTVVVGLGFLLTGVLTYQLMRVASYYVSKPSISAEAGQIHKWVKDGQAWTIATTSSAQNLERRTLLVIFLSSLLRHAQTQKTALGQDLLLQVEWAIPAAIFPDKPTMVEEDLASQTFHVFYPDEPNSIFTAGALDFGIWGVMIYPFVTVLLCSVVQRIVLTNVSYDVAVFGAFMFLQMLITPEHLLADYFIIIRNILVFGVFLYSLSKLPLFRLNSFGHGANS